MGSGSGRIGVVPVGEGFAHIPVADLWLSSKVGDGSRDALQPAGSTRGKTPAIHRLAEQFLGFWRQIQDFVEPGVRDASIGSPFTLDLPVSSSDHPALDQDTFLADGCGRPFVPALGWHVDVQVDPIQ